MLKFTSEQKNYRKQRIKRRRAEREWESQFPPLSCHPPFVSSKEMDLLEKILEERRRKSNPRRPMSFV